MDCDDFLRQHGAARALRFRVNGCTTLYQLKRQICATPTWPADLRSRGPRPVQPGDLIRIAGDIAARLGDAVRARGAYGKALERADDLNRQRKLPEQASSNFDDPEFARQLPAQDRFRSSRVRDVLDRLY